MYLQLIQSFVFLLFFSSNSLYGVPLEQDTYTQKEETESLPLLYEKNEDNFITRVYTTDGSIDYRYTFNNSGQIIKALDAISGHCIYRHFSKDGTLLEDGEESKSVSIQIIDNTQTSFQLPDGSTIEDYDIVHYEPPASKFSKKNSDTVEYTYDALGRLSSALDIAEGIQETYRYDGFHRIQEIICIDTRTHVVLSNNNFLWFDQKPIAVRDTNRIRRFSTNVSEDDVLQKRIAPMPNMFQDMVDHIGNGGKFFYNQLSRTFSFSQAESHWFQEYRALFEDVAFQILSSTWLKMIGYNPDASHIHAIGDFSKKQPNIYITHINGILNISKDQIDNASVVSKTHGNYPVHYVYAATSGFTADLLRCGFAKSGLISGNAELLALLWKSLIQTMDNIEGGMIIHYAHSLGGTDTAAALRLLSDKERSIIRVVTFGSATLIPEGMSRSIDNYVSLKDGVPWTDPQAYMQGLMGIRGGIHFLASDTLPLIDHIFTNETYYNVLSDLGTKFQEDFGIDKSR